jgi:SagB-type dehydrogenase family enzyme
MTTAEREAGLETALLYHEETKHHLHRFARSLGYLAWEDQPNPFREFQGASRTGQSSRTDQCVELPLAREEEPLPFVELLSGQPATARDLSLRTLGRFFELSLAISAWKEIPGHRWALRINPSSGNLHPTEAYALLPAMEELGSGGGVYHYLSRDHALELRSSWNCSETMNLKDSPAAGFYLAFTSVPWRESWKYGERAFRYCQHDLGHALAAVRFSAATLGWTAQLQTVAPEYLVWLLGLEPPAHPLEPEIPEALVWIQTAAAEAPFALPAAESALEWFGQPNLLSAGHQPWPLIDEVVAATEDTNFTNYHESVLKDERSGQSVALPLLGVGADFVSAAAIRFPPAPPGPEPRPVLCLQPAERIIRQRRSALSFDGATALSRTAFLQMLDQTLPRPQIPPFDLWQLPVRVHLVLFVHRVTGLAPGLYLWLRDERQLQALRAAFGPGFVWKRDEECPLFELKQADLREFSKTVCCHQAVASDGAFSLGMLAQFEPVLRACGPHAYRELFWETGVIGQSLYLGAEAAGMRGTGIGCFFDNVLHEALGLKDHAWQSLYHFTVGAPVDDPRLRSAPPYERKR